jgi:hypothetical protein
MPDIQPDGNVDVAAYATHHDSQNLQFNKAQDTVNRAKAGGAASNTSAEAASANEKAEKVKSSDPTTPTAVATPTDQPSTID